MKLLKKCLAVAAVVSALGVTGSANATLTNWYVDTDGVGGNAATLVNDYLDLTGVAYAHNTFTSATTFTFKESGLFETPTADGPVNSGGTALNPVLSAAFTGTGTGTTGGLLSFLTGSLTVTQGATTVGTFDLLSGSANLAAGTVLPNGAISLIFQATSLTAGYFYDSGMVDLSTILASNPLVFGFATTNVIPLTRNVGAPLQNLYNATFDPDQLGVITPNNTTDLHLSNNGQFRLQVPEPGTLALFGISLLGIVGLRRRNANA